MIHNRSVPVDRVLPHVYYERLNEAADWLRITFGFAEYFRFSLPDGQPHGVMMHLGDAWIMLKNAEPGTNASRSGSPTHTLMFFLEDVREHYRSTVETGAIIIEELNETEYGELQYVARDPEGHHWLFAEHVADVYPGDWGAVVSQPS